jgi:hypothetical protein
MAKFLSLICLLFTGSSGFGQQMAGRYFNILDFGAVADTAVVNTRAINAAIERCFQAGGGQVVIPAGRFVSGTLVLRDHVELHLENGAFLLASYNYEDFPRQPLPRYRSQKDGGGWYALIYAEGANHIAITGAGTIDGRGRGKKGRRGSPGGDRDGRPRNLLLISCRNVRIEGVNLYNSAIWNQHYLDCEDVTVNNIQVYNHCNGNNDGIDIDGCRRFVLSNSIIDSDDDGIVLKSTGPAPCENITISNCIVSSFANAIKCGTESTGGFRNIQISGCVVKPSRSQSPPIVKVSPIGITGISLEIVDGGLMEGVSVSNITIEGTQCPLYVRLANRARKHREDAPAPGQGIMRNIMFSNILAYGTGNYGSSITGIPGARIEHIYLNNVRFVSKGGLVKGRFTPVEQPGAPRHDVAKDSGQDTYLASYRNVKEDEQGYPQPTVWRNLPSYGMFIRHVNNIVVDNASFLSAGTEPRVAVIAVHTTGLQLNRIQTMASPAQVILHNVREAFIDKGMVVKKE